MLELAEEQRQSLTKQMATKALFGKNEPSFKTGNNFDKFIDGIQNRRLKAYPTL